jgi:MarR family transcriptional repressor of emrRAB
MTPDLLRTLDLAERLGNLAQARLKAVGARRGLQPAHLRILLYLAAANRYSNTPQAVADYLGLTKGTVSQSLILLETKGLIERGADARDRRVVRLALTPLGQALVEPARREGTERWGAAAGALPEGVLYGLTEILRQLQLLEGRRSFGVCRSCRHHLTEGPGRWRCGLTGEPLSGEDRESICREHEAVAA